MPIVNRANYVECPSCHRWMHREHDKLDGNRANICQECYERADAKNQFDPIKAGCAPSLEAYKAFQVDEKRQNAQMQQMADDHLGIKSINGYVIVQTGESCWVEGTIYDTYEEAKEASDDFLRKVIQLNGRPPVTVAVATIGAPSARAVISPPTDGEAAASMDAFNASGPLRLYHVGVFTICQIKAALAKFIELRSKP